MGRIQRTHFCFLLGICLFLAGGGGCTGGEGPVVPETGDGEPATCDATVTPVVFVHGFVETGDAFANQSMRFATNGYCLDRVFAFDWNTVGDFAAELERLAGYLDEVLAETGAPQVDLAGHSMGTALSAAYLEDPAHAAKVAHYAGLAGLSADAPPGGVPCMTISSEDDHIAGRSYIEGAENVLIPGLDHLQVATSQETFRNLYLFFNHGAEPRTAEMEPTAEVRLSGRLLSFAENQPASGMEFVVYPVDPATGERLGQDPVASFVTDAQGAWGPFDAEPGRYYEYLVIDPGGTWVPIHYYREPLPRTCRLAHFRVFPPAEGPLGFLFQQLLGFNPEGVLLATLNMNQAVVYGRDTFFADGYEVSIPEVTSADKTTIAIFYTDFPAVDPGEAPGLNELLAFIQTFDLVVEADTPRSVPLAFNGRDLAVRNWRSGTDGVVIGVFE